MNFVEQKNYDITSGDSKNFCIEENINEFLSKYYILINQYLSVYTENIQDNITINTSSQYRYYIIIKGLEMLTNIINITIIHTNNIDLAFHYCNKAYYYYIEFISQIDNDNNHLELNIKDAIIFVYKKTIFEIREPLSSLNNSNINTENIQKINNIEKMVDIINTYLKIFKIKDILGQNKNNNSKYIVESNNTYISDEAQIDRQFLKIINKIEKNYLELGETGFHIFLTNISNIFNSILKIINKFDIIDSEINQTFSFSQLITLIDKIITRIIHHDSIIIFDTILDENTLISLNNVKIREIIAIFKD